MAGRKKMEPSKLLQPELDALAKSLDIHYAVLDNLSDGHATYQAAITICNKGDIELGYANWSIFFSHIRMIEPHRLPCDDGILLSEGLHLLHINGCLFRMQPTPDFTPLSKGQAVTIPFKGQYYSVARSDILPNWYLSAEGLEPRIIECTAGESLDFVAPFDTASKWKRFDYILSKTRKRRYDFYDPFTPEARFERNATNDLGKVGKLVIPTPFSISVNEAVSPMKFDGAQWTVVYDPAFQQEAEYLAGELGTKISPTGSSSASSSHMISLVPGEVSVGQNKKHTNNEAYKLHVSTTQQQVRVTAKERAGIFWGVQSLISLVSQGSLPEVEIKDAPRYPYRGMHADVSRNFHSKASVLRLLEVMARYKLNKFHFHLTDDEGWRLQIPGLEELTEVGSRRCHSKVFGSMGLLPLLGSGPHISNSGTGFYTVEDYREILQFATQRHIEVIPEIDMPGHCHAAVKAMQVRYSRLKEAGDVRAAEEYLLSDLSATTNSDCQSVQMFSENSLNPGLPSTFSFIGKVMQEIQRMHQDICPLQMFHFGGDEVPYEAWEESPACQALIDSGQVSSFKHLMEYFVVKVADIASELNLDVGAWQDGVVHKFEPPFPRKKFPNKRVAVYAWKNVWESGMASDVYKLANANYQVVLSPGTHMYFDHPQEPDPEERGLYWACRYADTSKVFAFAPDNLFSNADVRLTGEAFSSQDVKGMLEDEEFEPLEKAENIVGLQGQLWTELVRTSDQFDAMIFPRLLALAERAWHEASWEGLGREERRREEGCREDWCQFANTLGYRDLGQLDRWGVQYYLPPPGARLQEGCYLEVNSQIPGLPVQYSTDNGDQWLTYTQPVDVTNTKDLIILRTCSADGRRHSRIIKMSPKGETTGDEDS
ncbi:chitobiase-like [Babylonia areolata]|uniref:chitobiase-like n=1 Tax=Babylonia areolata TaxID=304850 RepID=UPI003FD64F3E